MSMNVFQWIREGVKHSVLLGFSDAIEQLGPPPNQDELSAEMLEFMESRPSAAKRAGGASKRKRLGRTLKQLEPQSATATATATSSATDAAHR